MAVHVHRRAVGLDLPRPLRSAWPFLALCLVALALDATPRLPWLVGVGIALVFLVAGGVRAGRAYLELRSLRAAADRQILRGVRKPYSAFIAWRADELIGPGSRRRFLRPLLRLIRDLERATLPGASPVNRVVARQHLESLHELAERLGDESRPVEARALLLLDQFLTSPGSPLYARERATRFERSVTEIRRELD